MNKTKENVALGAVGALLFSLAGLAVYYLIYQMGMIAGLSGLVAVFCSYFGYGLFSGNKNSMTGLIFAGTFSVLAMIAAEYICVVKEFYDVYSPDYTYLGYELTVGGAFEIATQSILGNQIVDVLPKGDTLHLVWGTGGDNAELISAMFKDVGMSLLFCALACYGFFRNTAAKIKAAKAAEAAAQIQNPAEF